MRVCIVMNPLFGAWLERLDKSAPVWIVQSPTNDPFIEERWSKKIGDATRFNPQSFTQLLATVDEHHPGWRGLEVFGLDVGVAAPALREYGDGIFTATNDGFIFEKM